MLIHSASQQRQDGGRGYGVGARLAAQEAPQDGDKGREEGPRSQEEGGGGARVRLGRREAKLQDLAVKVLETKFLVFFFATNNFASVSFKMIDPLKLEEMTEEEDEPVAQAVMQSTRRLLLFFLDKGDLQLKPTTQEAAKKAKGGDSQSIDKFRRWLWDVYVSFILEMLQ
ncbi:hypothetical protein PR003_g30850 [Phytophthora rubi]|uniref:Uncharacterized protein n=1 Tax=Phytophthora rubi TaxID=129364 RepID=A0A6A4B9I9_9STRA|nr:hypothetical protein PR003_g30850 [Phytophthora rubi]